jgi:hypothetical protein
MSGNKRATVTISQDEYDRLRDAEGKLRTLPEPAADTTETISQQSIDLLRSNLDEVQHRQARFLDFIGSVDTAVQNLERETSLRLGEIEQQALADVEQQVGSLRMDFNRTLADQQRRYEEMVLALHRQQQAELALQAADLDRVYQDFNHRSAVAAQWLDDFSRLSGFISENYALDFFFPGMRARIEQQLTRVEGNFENGFLDAVLLASQQGFQELAELRLELEVRHAEWNLLFLTVWEAMNQEIAQVENSSYIPAFDLDGNELPYLVDVDFWQSGELDQIHFALSEMGRQLLDQTSLPGTETLKTWLSETLPDLHQKLENAVIDARIKTINSQLRINVADLVVQALQEQGFALSACAYHADDQRQGYGARLTNPEGNEVIVQVSPSGEAVGENELQIQSLDSEDRTEHELERRWQEINQSLRRCGVDVGAYERLDVPKRSHPQRAPLLRQRSPLRLTPKTG